MSDENLSESGNWNFNAQYIQILGSHFSWIKEYKKIAKYGSSDIFEDFQIDEKTKIRLRIKALDRYIFEIKEVINDTMFAIQNGKVKADIAKFEEYYGDLTFFQNNVLPKITRKIMNKDKVEITINEDIFNYLFEKLDKIDMNLKSPMNRNDLIFNYKERRMPGEAIYR